MGRRPCILQLMRATLTLVLVCTIALPTEADRNHPLRNGVIPEGSGWWCTRSESHPQDVTVCYRVIARCDYLVNSKTEKFRKCLPLKTAACLTYRKKLDGEYDWDCHETFRSCKAHRDVYLTDQKDDVDGVSDCIALR